MFKNEMTKMYFRGCINFYGLLENEHLRCKFGDAIFDDKINNFLYFYILGYSVIFFCLNFFLKFFDVSNPNQVIFGFFYL